MAEGKRKKWTPIEEPDESVLKIREKRRWQIALRRYIIEKNKCVQYAPYFGLDIETFRKWIEAQFTEGLGWENFSDKWQFDHAIPVNYFDFSREDELRLCWNFLNIRVNANVHEGHKTDLLAAKSYFEGIKTDTGLTICDSFLQKITSIVDEQVVEIASITSFLKDASRLLGSIEGFEAYEFQQLNEGVALEEVLAERTLLKNFG